MRCCERDQIVIIGVARMHRRVGVGINDDRRTAYDPADQLGRVRLADMSPQLGVRKRALELVQKRLGRD
jgi:hypothetical protein